MHVFLSTTNSRYSSGVLLVASSAAAGRLKLVVYYKSRTNGYYTNYTGAYCSGIIQSPGTI